MAAYYVRCRIRNDRVISERQTWLDAYKLERGCQDCGYSVDPRALDLDHRNPATKVGNVSRLLRFAPWPVVLEELAKCDVLCANCHRVKTFSGNEHLERRRPALDLLTETEDGPSDEILRITPHEDSGYVHRHHLLTVGFP